MGYFDKISAAAVSFTVAGNTGVAPFLSLFLVGVIERADPDALNMEGTIETLLSSWPSLLLTGVLTLLEFVSMCVPVVDEIVDSVMTFVLPVMSTIGSLSTFGLLTQSEAGEGNRELSAASGALVFFKIFLVITGIILAFAIHAFKMLIRLIGEGWLTNCLTIIETTWIVTTITLAIFIRQIAVIVACLMCTGAFFSIKRHYWDKRHDDNEPLADQAHQAAGDAVVDEEQAVSDVVHKDDEYVKVEDLPLAQVIAVEGEGTVVSAKQDAKK